MRYRQIKHLLIFKTKKKIAVITKRENKNENNTINKKNNNKDI